MHSKNIFQVKWILILKLLITWKHCLVSMLPVASQTRWKMMIGRSSMIRLWSWTKTFNNFGAPYLYLCIWPVILSSNNRESLRNILLEWSDTWATYVIKRTSAQTVSYSSWDLGTCSWCGKWSGARTCSVLLDSVTYLLPHRLPHRYGECYRGPSRCQGDRR